VPFVRIELNMQIICKFLIYMVFACKLSVAAVRSHYAKTIHIDVNSLDGYYKYSYVVLANLNSSTVLHCPCTYQTNRVILTIYYA